MTVAMRVSTAATSAMNGAPDAKAPRRLPTSAVGRAAAGDALVPVAGSRRGDVEFPGVRDDDSDANGSERFSDSVPSVNSDGGSVFSTMVRGRRVTAR